jgi:hypothetical protein
VEPVVVIKYVVSNKSKVAPAPKEEKSRAIAYCRPSPAQSFMVSGPVLNFITTLGF